MASVAQLTANRLNAQRSTGPRTEDGKSVSRFNALKFGVDARSRVIPGEDPAELEALSGAYYEQFAPVGPLESYLVETIVAADWNRRRYTRVEAQLYRMLMSLPGAPADSDPLSAPASAFGDDVAGARILQSVFRQLAAAERSYFRALKELRRAQQDRLAEQADGDSAPADPLTLAVAASLPQYPPQPMAPAAQIGFVPPDRAGTAGSVHAERISLSTAATGLGAADRASAHE